MNSYVGVVCVRVAEPDAHSKGMADIPGFPGDPVRPFHLERAQLATVPSTRANEILHSADGPYCRL